MVGNESTDVRRDKRRHVRVIVTSAVCRIEVRARCDGCPCVFHIGRRTACGYARASSRCTNSRRGARIHIDNRHIAIYVGRQFAAASPAAPPRCSTRSTPPPRRPRARCTSSLVESRFMSRCRSGGVQCCNLSTASGYRRTAALAPCVGACESVRRRASAHVRDAIAATAPGHHARDCAARLGPVKAFRADCRYAPTPDGAVGLDRPFGRAGTWLLRDGPPTTDVAASDCAPRAARTRRRRRVRPDSLGMGRPRAHNECRVQRTKEQRAMTGDERIDARGAVCAGVEQGPGA